MYASPALIAASTIGFKSFHVDGNVPLFTIENNIVTITVKIEVIKPLTPSLIVKEN
jgi:hypothetical protein